MATTTGNNDFNPSNLTGVVLNGGKTLPASGATAQGLRVDPKTTIPGLRFKTRVEGRGLNAFAPFSQIVGVSGTMQGMPKAHPSITFDPSGLSGLFLIGGRLFRVKAAEFLHSQFGDSLKIKTYDETGREDELTVSLSQIIAFLGDFKTDYELEDESEEKKYKETVESMAVYGCDSATYLAAREAQLDEASGRYQCAACGGLFPDFAYITPVYVAGVGVVHREVPCNPFSAMGLVTYNENYYNREGAPNDASG